uniref:branched-chain amino acid ABC transporter substrate-binding protein n=1 Tax=Rhodoferax sp. GW822-FHT02A01 TaxID=3141537 RepID=UPI00406CCBC5
MKLHIQKSLVGAALLTAFAMTSGAWAQNVKIAVAGPMTGGAASYGEEMKKGAQMAADDINAAGGINGKKVELVFGDDACEPKQAVAVASRLIEKDKVAAVVGHFCSSSTMPASEVYAEADMLMVTPASTNPKVTDRKLPSIMRVCGRDDQQGVIAANYIVDKLKAKRIAMVHDKDTYGQGIVDATKAQLGKRGVKEVLYEGLTRGEKDFNALVTKIKSTNPDLIYFGGLSAEAGTLLRQIREQGLTTTFMSADGAVDASFATAAGGNAALKGVLITFGDDPRDNPIGKAVVQKFRASGFEPAGYTMYTYIGVQTVAAALKSAKSSSGAAMAAWLKANPVDTVLGKKAWDANGDLTVADYVVYQYKDDGTYAKVAK